MLKIYNSHILRHNLIYAWLFACFLFFLAWFYVVYGAGLRLTNDSYYYLAAAQSLSQNGQLQNPDGSLFAYWTPFYPLILSLGSLFMDIKTWAALLNAIAISASFYWCLRLLTAHTQGRIWQWYLALLLGSATPLLFVSHFLWSESVFLAFFLGFCYFYEQKKMSYEALILGICAMMVRNVGLALVLFWIIGQGLPKPNPKFRLKIIALFAPSLLWNSYVLTHTAWWSDLWDSTTPPPYFLRLWNTLTEGGALLFPSSWAANAYLTIGLLVVWSLCLYLKIVRKPIYVLFWAYLLLLTVFYVPKGELSRLLSVMYPFLLLTMLATLAWLVMRFRYLRYVCFLLLTLFVLLSLLRFYKNLIDFEIYSHMAKSVIFVHLLI